MKVIENEMIIFCDVDDTLILHDIEKHTYAKTIVVTDPYCGSERVLAVHEPHVQLLTERAARGAYIIVMSHGGYRWAEAVVKALKLEKVVSEVMSKPIAVIDDLPIAHALGDTTYLKPDSKWKKNG